MTHGLERAGNPVERQQFTFYRSYYEALKTLPKKEREAVVMAMCAYALDEEEPHLSGVPASCFTLIRPTLDSGRNKARNRSGKTKTKEEQTDNKPEERRKEKEGEIEREVERENDSYISPGGDMKRSAVAAVMSAYLDKITATPSQTSLEELKGYAETMGAECCLRAIDIALDERKASWSYIRGILRSKASQGVRCLADWDRIEAERRIKRGTAGNTGGGPGEGQGRTWDLTAAEL